VTARWNLTNRAYAVAKIAGVEMCRSYNRQYGTATWPPCRRISTAPTTTTISKCARAAGAHTQGARSEDGRPRSRGDLGDGFAPAGVLYSDEMADACVMMMNLPDEAFDEVLARSQRFPAHQRRMRRRPDHR